ncbi:MAG: hypothetical protein PWQ12_1840 [Clostridiales bacterium]|jgi:hypothetical protein|nr:hypothetical protein [Clostridiales bacterium]
MKPEKDRIIKSTGMISLIVGIIILSVAIPCGVLNIVNGARLLKLRKAPVLKQV